MTAPNPIVKKSLGLWLTLAVAAFCGSGCYHIGTEKEYLNHIRVPAKAYKTDVATLTDSIRKLIEKKQGPFSAEENDSLTQIVIDTVLYSPRMDRIAFFVIAKNSNDKQLGGGSKNEYHYDANAFIALVDTSRRIHGIVWVSAFSEEDSDIQSASQGIREMYFKGFRERKGKHVESLYKYNWDDIRFWNGPLWDGARHPS